MGVRAGGGSDVVAASPLNKSNFCLSKSNIFLITRAEFEGREFPLAPRAGKFIGKEKVSVTVFSLEMKEQLAKHFPHTETHAERETNFSRLK